MTWSDKKVLITGAGGFIGSHLTQELARRGARVVALTHYNSRNDRGNLEHLPPDELGSVDVVMGDIQDAGCVRRAVEGCDCVFHLAALIGIPYSYTAPRSYTATNIGGTLNILEAVKSCETPRLVHTSTSEVYGTARYTPIDEDHPLQGQSPYSATKIGADKLVESYHRSFGLPAATVRPFNTFGPRQSARAVIPTIVAQLIAGDSVYIGSLEPVRDLTYVEDTVSGFVAIAEQEAAIGEVVNLGTGTGVSIGELAELLIRQINPSARMIHSEERVRPEASEVLKLICAADKAKRLTGWTPAISLEEGLERATRYVRDRLDDYRIDQYVL